MEDYYEYLDSNGVTTLYKLIKDDTVALIDSYSVTINGITTNLDTHVNNADIHTPIATIEGMIDNAVGSLNYATPDYVDTKVADLVNSSPETLDTLKELSDALGNDSNFATTVANQIGSKASKDDVYTKLETDTLLEGKANSVHTHVVSDITDFPTIPTKVSDLTNDSGYITSVSWEDVTSKPELSQVAISGSYSDLSDTPIIPTKTSQLINDSGFLTSSNGLITSVSWSDITNKPNFSTVATSGSYTDLSNTPTIPTKVSQLENDMGFGTGGDTSDCVHKTGDETIAGVKNFTSDIVRKYTAVDITTTPTSDLQSRINFTDKNDKIIAYIQYAQKTKGVNYIGLRVRDKNSTTCGVQLNTNKEFVPLGNNSYSLGSSSYKWLKVYSDDVVHTSGNETINGIKTFNDTVVQKKDGIIKNDNVDITTTPSSNLFTHLFFSDKNDAANAFIRYGQRTNGINELNLFVRDKDLNNYGVSVNTNNEFIPVLNNTYNLGSAGVKWKKIYSDDVVHTSGTETINGSKTFTSSINLKNNNIDLTVTPSNTLTSNIIFKDKNDQNVSFIQYAKRDAEPDILGLYIYDKDKNLHGLQITSNNYVLPRGHNTYNLGSPNNKWLKIYSDDVVHTSGNENISGTKMFSNTIHRYADLTASGAEQVYAFSDTNANACGHIYNNVHRGGDCIYNRHGAYNNKSSKTMDINIASNDVGFGMVSVEGSATNGNLETATSATNHTAIATMGWVNNPATSTNVVHRSGDENIAGNKLFGDKIICTRFTNYINNGQIYITGGSEWDKGATLSLHGEESNDAGAFVIASKDKTRTLYLIGRPDGTLIWAGQNIATTEWVSNYVNSRASFRAVGPNAVDSSISAYYSNATTLTAEGNSSSSNGPYPADYSDYINIAPTVGTIYTGSQLFSSFTPTASGTIEKSGSTLYQTTAKATATFSGAFSASAKYLCTTANAVKFRAYVSQGTSSDIGGASVVDNSSAKSIFTRIE